MRKIIAIILLTIILSFALLLGAGLDLYNFARQPGAARQQLVTIPNGSSLKAISSLLSKSGSISSPKRFIILCRLLGHGSQLKAGEYMIPAAATPLQIIEDLCAGKVFQHQLTIPEGFTLKQIGARLNALGLCDGDEFGRLIQDRDFLQACGLQANRAEGYLFPETYNYTSSSTCREILQTMLETGRQRIASIIPEKESRHQLLTLASIIQKEAGNDAEMPLISSVFHNRLRKKMRLESDPTTIYAMGDDFDGNLRRADLKHPSPYNTYRHRGLPPGPICSPGQKALQAARNPATSNYLFFVARRDGTHQFSRSLREHRQAVRKYQLNQP